MDGCSLGTHVLAITTMLTHTGVTCTQEQLERSLHCAAGVLLQMAPRLEEVH